jgi:hypothetical protein
MASRDCEMKTLAGIEFGDFQTPLDLAKDICALLARQGLEPKVVIEPTCGTGAFLVAAILNTPHCLDFMAALMFSDNKRPVTVELLQRLNLSAIAQDAGLAEQWKAIQRVATCNLQPAAP